MCRKGKRGRSSSSSSSKSQRTCTNQTGPSIRTSLRLHIITHRQWQCAQPEVEKEKGGGGGGGKGSSRAPAGAVDVRKLAAASAQALRDVPVEAHAKHLARLESALEAESQKASSECKEHPLMSDDATDLRKELLNNAIEGGKEMQRAMDMVKSSDFKAIHENDRDLEELGGFPSEAARLPRVSTGAIYKMYQNGFANLVHAERPVAMSVSSFAEHRQSRQRPHQDRGDGVDKPWFSAAKLSKQMMLGRGGGRPRVQLASVPCHAFGHALMDQISMAAVGLARTWRIWTLSSRLMMMMPTRRWRRTGAAWCSAAHPCSRAPTCRSRCATSTTRAEHRPRPTSKG